MMEKTNCFKSNRRYPAAATRRSRLARRAAFTLVEMMVALSILVLLLGIIFVPLNQAITFLSLGQARSSLQQSGRQTLVQMTKELRTAVRVYPNDILPGVTSEAPYNGFAPYCDGATRVSNTSRIDFIPADVDADGNVLQPIRPGKYLVTYYARRMKTGAGDKYDSLSNPIFLYRAQSPIKNSDGTTFMVGTNPNVDTSSSRYSSSCGNPGSDWLQQQDIVNVIDNEPANLGPDNDASKTSGNEPTGVAGSHTLAIPLGTALFVPKGSIQAPSIFTCEDSSRDGKIDRVSISLALQQFDTGATGTSDGKQPNAQTVRLPAVVDLPNVQ